MTKTKKAAGILSIVVLFIVAGIVLTKIIDQRSVADAATDSSTDMATNHMMDYYIANATTDVTSNMMVPEVPLHEKTYYDVLSGLIGKYGIAIGEGDLNSDKGVFYAGLFDFNNDDKSELLVFYYDDYVFGYEIWTNDGDDIEKLNSRIYECYGLRTSYEISVSTIDGRNCLVEVQDAYALAGIDGGRFSTVYTVENDQWVQEGRFEYKYLYKDGMEDDPVFMEIYKDMESGEYYRIIKDNELEELTKEQYNQVVDRYYNNSCINVIRAGGGEPVKYGITIDMSDNNKQLVDFMKVLEEVQDK